jgi:aspartate oxidase
VGCVLTAPEVRGWDESRVADSDEDVVIKQNWTELRRFMWNYVGIVRTNKRLERAAHRIALLQSEVAEYYGNVRVTADLIELRNLLQAADLIVQSARARRESRGLHYNQDFPRPSPPRARPSWCRTEHPLGQMLDAIWCGTGSVPQIRPGRLTRSAGQGRSAASPPGSRRDSRRG